MQEVCLFRSLRGLYNFTSPGDLISVVIGVIAVVQNYFTARCRRRRHHHSLPVVPHAFVEQSFVMVADASGDINLGANFRQTIRINLRVVFEFVVDTLEVYELVLCIRFDRCCQSLVHHRTRFYASGVVSRRRDQALGHRDAASTQNDVRSTAAHWRRMGGAAAAWRRADGAGRGSTGGAGGHGTHRTVVKLLDLFWI